MLTVFLSVCHRVQTSCLSLSCQVGVSLLLVGIVALNRVRMEIPLEKENQTKLVKFMIRMGVFSVLYLVPLLTVIGCYLYEHTYRNIWETTWMEENCRHYHIPCPYKVGRESEIGEKNVSVLDHVMLLSLQDSMFHWLIAMYVICEDIFCGESLHTAQIYVTLKVVISCPLTFYVS